MSESRIDQVTSLKSSKTREDHVKDFHDKLDVSPQCRLAELEVDDDVDELLETMSEEIAEWAERLCVPDLLSDPRILRAHLIAEEFAELLEALRMQNELHTLDALADLHYVTSGTAVTFDLPLEAAFFEVHRSNMTKEKQVTDEHGARVRDKGPNYSKPDLLSVLKEYRRR